MPNGPTSPQSDPPDPQNADTALEGRLRVKTRFAGLLHVPSCESTQDIAQARTDESESFIVWADAQNAGRGRGQRRHWHGASGQDVEATFCVQSAEIGNPTTLAAALPALLADALEPLADRPIRIKWPNDLLCDGRKLAGILIDAAGNPPRNFAIGIGTNVNRTTFPPELTETATSLALSSGTTLDRHDVLETIACAVDRTITALIRGQHATLATRFRSRLALIGHPVEILSSGADATPDTGILTDIDLETATLDGSRRHPLGFVRRLGRVER